MAAVFDAPVASDPFVPLLWRWSMSGRNPKDDLAGLPAKAGRRIAPADRALRPHHGFDERFPRRMAEPRFGGKDGQLACFPTISALGFAFRKAARFAAGGAEFQPAAQAGLIALHLRQQMIARGNHAFEQFF